jgi:N12 class adenine-specific DNA methylase
MILSASVQQQSREAITGTITAGGIALCKRGGVDKKYILQYLTRDSDEIAKSSGEYIIVVPWGRKLASPNQG